jgi:hypothetical protein
VKEVKEIYAWDESKTWRRKQNERKLQPSITYF